MKKETVKDDNGEPVMVKINKKLIPKKREVLTEKGMEVFKKIHKKIDVIARC